jgi:pimeloyl-ACP methyl ester carboxylesterase
MMREKFAIALIDGTGDWDNGDYAVSMAGSFCTQLKARFGTRAQYERGPSFEGYRVRERGQRAADFLDRAAKVGCDQLFLAGYSRGGSAAVFAASILENMGRQISAMFLFDPVARHLTIGGEGIPANVNYCRAALRSDDPALIRKYEGFFPDPISANPMRPSFGHMNLMPAGSTRLDVRRFRGSHGALGGAGWKRVTEDIAAQQDVASYMTAGLVHVGLPARLISIGP